MRQERYGILVGAEQPGQQTGEHQVLSKEAAAAEGNACCAISDKVRQYRWQASGTVYLFSKKTDERVWCRSIA